MRSSWLRSIFVSGMLLFLLLPLLPGCKQTEGERCQTNADCEEDLVCCFLKTKPTTGTCLPYSLCYTTDSGPADGGKDARPGDGKPEGMAPDRGPDSAGPDGALPDSKSTPDLPLLDKSLPDTSSAPDLATVDTKPSNN